MLTTSYYVEFTTLISEITDELITPQEHMRLSPVSRLATYATGISQRPDHLAHLLTYPATMARQPMTKHKLPAVWMRAGTSKGLFIKREHLPVDQTKWIEPLLAAMGADSRQLNGVGGATSTTSKVAVVGKSAMEGVDVDYTFAQVSVGGEKVDFSGNCGNIASGVGPFAIQEGLVQQVKNGETKVLSPYVGLLCISRLTNCLGSCTHI